MFRFAALVWPHQKAAFTGMSCEKPSHKCSYSGFSFVGGKRVGAAAAAADDDDDDDDRGAGAVASGACVGRHGMCWLYVLRLFVWGVVRACFSHTCFLASSSNNVFLMEDVGFV